MMRLRGESGVEFNQWWIGFVASQTRTENGLVLELHPIVSTFTLGQN